MVDVHSRQIRSKNMAAIKSKDTKPEVHVRKYLHNHGLRFRLHGKNLPGKPDIVLPKYNSVVFVNGCYWHRHEGCKYTYLPKSNIDFWKNKFQENINRDHKNYSDLKKNGWKVIVIWECEVKNQTYQKWLLNKLRKPKNQSADIRPAT